MQAYHLFQRLCALADSLEAELTRATVDDTAHWLALGAIQHQLDVLIDEVCDAHLCRHVHPGPQGPPADAARVLHLVRKEVPDAPA